MSTPHTTVVASEQPTPITEEEFLQDVPPGQEKCIRDLVTEWGGAQVSNDDWRGKDLHLYCKSDECAGYRFFQSVQNYKVPRKGSVRLFLNYICRNCNKERKVYAVLFERLDDKHANIFKYGEAPPFGPPNPQKLMSLMGGERDAYLKGRRCENQGLGIGAFAYYRRVVENQKVKIIGEILKVAEKLNSDPELIADLKAAKLESQFSKAIDRIKHGLPQVLLVNGHNPLTLLHSALSEGLHAATDEDCLELATCIRVVLTDLVERMATAVKEEAQLTSAVERLAKAKAQR